MIDTTFAVSSPSYNTSGRQLRYEESPSQRNARHHFIRQGEGQRRVEDWVRGQQEQKRSLWGVMTVPEVHREPYVHHPNLFTIPEDPIRSSSPGYLVPPYIHSDEEEPFVLYSSAPSFYNSQIIYSTPLPSPAKKSSRRPKHMRHRQRLCGLDSIPEEIIVG
ncbi:uncharacterized protein BT62DRAFT_1002086 [Guyanagaster necrorhizus]|uniref:Uncharacterized protein n=1 Tax=Guyanagaster necrorhizus TaxID=856835 RepID=A0A9P7W0L1_9AGAR|nr:uncharacterized protein BT62DRAFT_1002086 [Guyanagaster necrorhizus MCA 3950]KAG7449774.1 hypothetical protein BT62DRAFT_1002086 [Guyanagaster necrorhizus MCA 3950]